MLIAREIEIDEGDIFGPSDKGRGQAVEQNRTGGTGVVGIVRCKLETTAGQSHDGPMVEAGFIDMVPVAAKQARTEFEPRQLKGPKIDYFQAATKARLWLVYRLSFNNVACDVAPKIELLGRGDMICRELDTVDPLLTRCAFAASMHETSTPGIHA
ncbi:hypothetical protein [Roseibium suaedae]|uniref:hypothetical protein n=1 Tax=Roseibium suaedae TaxID=735517 RepID=UPI002E276418